MDLAIITVDRPGAPYLYQSLLSLRAVARFSGTVHLFVGGAEAGYLDCLEGADGVAIHRLGAAECARIAGWPLHRRHSYNYWRALDHFAARGVPACVGEDDVLYDPHFGRKLAEATGELKARTDDYALSYYQATDLAADKADDPAVWHGRLVSAYPGPSFYGTQGVAYSAAGLRVARDLIRARAVDVVGEPTDLVIHELTNIYLVKISLVQHLGRESTGLGWFHTSPTFGRPWPGDGATGRAS